VPSFFSQSTPAHENSRDGRLVWTGTQEYLVSTGFNQVGLLVAKLDIHTTRAGQAPLEGRGRSRLQACPYTALPRVQLGLRAPGDRRPLRTGRFHLQ